MKKIILFLSFLLVSCGKEVMLETPHITDISDTILTKSEETEISVNKPITYTQNIKIRFLEFEASTFEVSVISDKTTSIFIGFFRADDVDCNGKPKAGKSFIRLQEIPVPDGVTVDYYGRDSVELTRSDESKHLLKFILPE